MPEQLLTVSEAAKALRVSGESVRRFLRLGRINGRKVGKEWRIASLDVRPPKPVVEKVDGPRARVVIAVPDGGADIEVVFGDGRRVNTTASEIRSRAGITETY